MIDSSKPDFYKNIIDNNKKWVESKLNLEANYFNKLSQ